MRSCIGQSAGLIRTRLGKAAASGRRSTSSSSAGASNWAAYCLRYFSRGAPSYATDRQPSLPCRPAGAACRLAATVNAVGLAYRLPARVKSHTCLSSLFHGGFFQIGAASRLNATVNAVRLAYRLAFKYAVQLSRFAAPERSESLRRSPPSMPE